MELSGARLAGKVAIVTGAGADAAFMGIGGATARLFGAQGAKVVVFDVSRERADATRSAIEKAGGDAEISVGDVTTEIGTRAAVACAVERFGGLDVLINSAAVTDRIGAFDLAEWRRVVDINLLGPTMMTAAAVPAMERRGGGSIVNISSIAGMRGLGGGAYASAKAGLIGLTLETAHRNGLAGIRANCVAPGHIHTPMGYSTDENRELRRRAGLLGTEGTPWDVAYACLYLASDEARWITGVTLPVDAGTTATTPMGMYRRMIAGE